MSFNIDRSYSRKLSSLCLLFALFAAACSDSTGPDGGTSAARVAVILQGQGTIRPELYIQDLDGSNRTRIHFTGAADRIPGNTPLLPAVRDENILAMGPAEWSPDGSRLALVLTMANDQSMIVVINADGSNATVASVNTQIILSDIDWSADGKRLAYTMSTSLHARAIDVFVTHLDENRVQRLSVGLNLGIEGVEVRFNPQGTEVLVSEIRSELGAPLFDYVSRLTSISLANSTQTVLVPMVTGSIQGIARNGEWFLVLRKTALNGSAHDRALIRRAVVNGQETVLGAQPSIQFAELTNDEATIVYGLGVQDTPDFATIAATGGSPVRLLGVDRAYSVDLLPGLR